MVLPDIVKVSWRNVGSVYVYGLHLFADFNIVKQVVTELDLAVSDLSKEQNKSYSDSKANASLLSDQLTDF